MYSQVLLLGNGLNRCAGSESWNEFLNALKRRDDFDIDNLACPMYMKPVLLSNDSVDKSLREKSKKCYGKVKDPTLFKKALELGFDDIITTNYSYELELSAKGDIKNPDYCIAKMQKHTDAVKRCEPKYLLHTFNGIEYNGKQQRIWHIHGEARKPDSMVLGQYYYGNLFSKIKAYLDSKKNIYKENQDEGKETVCESWIDAFILGKVYVIGFGFDYSEFDLWWLLNRKKREKADHGKVFSFEPYNAKNAEKYELLKIMDVKVNNLGYDAEKMKDEDYIRFYEDALNHIEAEKKRRNV